MLTTGRLIEYSSIRPLPTFALLLKEKLCGCMHIGNLLTTIAITTTTVMSMTTIYKHLSFGILCMFCIYFAL